MITKPTASRAPRLLTLLLAVAALMLIAAPLAKGSDTFRFDNETEIPFTPDNQDEFLPECWYGATGVFHPSSKPSISGSITSEAGLECERDWWGSEVAFGQTYGGTWEEKGSPFYYWYGGTGAFFFNATDPLIGDSSVACPTTGAEWSEGNGLTPIESFMTSEAEGDVCTVEWLPGVSATALGLRTANARPRAGHVRIIDSLARVYGGKAHVRVEVFGLGHARHANTVTLKTAKGVTIGSATRRLPVGDKVQTIAVALSRPVLDGLGKGKDLRVHAVVRIDSPGGTGDTSSRLVLSERPAVRHPLPPVRNPPR